VEEGKGLIEGEKVGRGGGGGCGYVEVRLRLVKRHVVVLRLGRGDVGNGLAGVVVAPGAYRVKIGDEVGREMRGESLAAELRWEAGGEVLKEGELDQDGVARGPRGGLVGEQPELDRQVGALGGDGGVHAARVDLQPVALIGGQDGDGAVGGGAQLEDALQAVVLQHGAAKDGGELARCVAAQQIHLPKAVLGGDVALREDQVVHRVGVDVRHAASVAGHRYRRGEAMDGERAIKLRKVLAHRIADKVTPGEDCGRGECGDKREEQTEDEQPVARGGASGPIEVGYESGFECDVCCGRGFRLGVWCGRTIGRGVFSAVAFLAAQESPVAQLHLAGMSGCAGLSGVRVVAAHGL